MDRDLLPADSRRQVEVTPLPLGGGFSVVFRRQLGSLPVYGSGTTVEFHPQGEGSVLATHRPLAGGSTYPLRSAAAAWADGVAGHWYAADGILRGDPGVVVLSSFSADKVELCYLEADFNTVQQYLMPMYCFFDTQQHIRLFTPALSGEYLSR